MKEETKRKISNSMKGKNNPFYGKKHTKESLKKMSETKKRKYATLELIHPMLGKHHTMDTKRKIGESNKRNIETIKSNTKRINEWNRIHSNEKRNEKNPMWKGDNISYRTLHQWIRRNKTKKNDRCEICNQIKRLEIANISGEYKRDVNDYRWLCRRCHMREDKRLEKMILRNKKII